MTSLIVISLTVLFYFSFSRNTINILILHISDNDNPIVYNMWKP